MTKSTLLTLTLTLATLAPVAAQPPAAADPLDGQRLVVPLSSPGQPAVLEASLLMGTIHVEAYDGNEIVVVASRRERGEDDDCDGCDHDGHDEEGERQGLRRIPNQSFGLSIEERNNRVEVSAESWNRSIRLDIRVPRRTSLQLSTVNGGDLEASGVEGEHELQNTNGGISAIDVSGSVLANTTNGGIEVRLLRVTPDKAMSFSTWNGDIDVTFPPDLQALLLMNPGRGDLYTDFDVEVLPMEAEVTTRQQRKGYRVEIKQEVKAKVGGGGPEMRFRTYNGSVYVRKLSSANRP